MDQSVNIQQAMQAIIKTQSVQQSTQ